MCLLTQMCLLAQILKKLIDANLLTDRKSQNAYWPKSADRLIPAPGLTARTGYEINACAEIVRKMEQNSLLALQGKIGIFYISVKRSHHIAHATVVCIYLLPPYNV